MRLSDILSIKLNGKILGQNNIQYARAVNQVRCSMRWLCLGPQNMHSMNVCESLTTLLGWRWVSVNHTQNTARALLVSATPTLSTPERMLITILFYLPESPYDWSKICSLPVWATMPGSFKITSLNGNISTESWIFANQLYYLFRLKEIAEVPWKGICFLSALQCFWSYVWVNYEPQNTKYWGREGIKAWFSS